MRMLFKYKTEIIVSIILALIFFFLRLIYLDRLPIFTDEAIYVRWAQIALNDSSWRFISLSDGKQPMYVWVAVLFMKFVSDPLIAGRLVSVATGFFTLIGLWFLSYELFKNKKIAFLTSTLYVFFPLAQVLDRMALYDSMVGTFYVWALYFSIRLVRSLRLDSSYTLGFAIGAGVLTKSINFFNIYLLPLTLILFDFKSKNVGKRLLRWIVLAGFSSLIAYGLYNILRLSPLFQMIEAKNATFIFPFSEWIQHPFTFFVGNLHGLFSWLIEYLKIPYIVLIFVSYLFINKYPREKLLLSVYFLGPFILDALFGKVIFPRYLLFMSLMLLPLAAWGLDYLIQTAQTKIKLNIPKSIYTLVLTIIFVVYSGFVSWQFAYDPVNAQIASADHSQYLSSGASGWGVKESVAFFREKAKDQKIFIATEGTFGLLPESMEMYLVDNKNVTIKGYWPVDNVSKEALAYAQKMPSYFIFYQKEHVVIPPSFPLKLLFKIEQGDSNTFYRVYQIIPPTNK